MFSNIIADGLTVSGVFACIGVSVACGVMVAAAYAVKNRFSKNFLISLVLLPVLVQAVIMMVNGKIGTGVAVLGAFSLIRFRSVPGNAQDICCIFFVMAAGIATGIGQIYFALIFTAAACAIFIALKFVPLEKAANGERELKVTIPEDVDFETEFSNIFSKYTKFAEILRIKTSNMGSLYVVLYRIKLKDVKSEKQFIDEIRVRNGNLPVVSSHCHIDKSEL